RVANSSGRLAFDVLQAQVDIRQETQMDRTVTNRTMAVRRHREMVTAETHSTGDMIMIMRMLFTNVPVTSMYAALELPATSTFSLLLAASGLSAHFPVVT